MLLRGCNTIDDTTRVEVQSDENGKYTFDDIIAGTYAVSASIGKWDASVNAIAQNVEVVRGKTKIVNLDIPEAVEIVNGGFENGDTTGWTSTGSSGKASKDTKHGHVYAGKYGYTVWKGSDFTVALDQKLTDLENGTYVVQMTVAGGAYGAEDEFYLYAKNAAGEIVARENVPVTVNGKWELVGLTAEVTDGALTFGLAGNLSANAWANMDDFRIGKVGEPHIVEEIDKTELEALILEVKALDISVYTSASVSEYQAAVEEVLSAAENVMNSDTATKDEVADAVEELKAAFNTGKEKLVTLEKKLEQDIADSIKDVKNQEEYTEASWEAYQLALQAVQALQGSTDLTEDKLNAAIADLKKAVSGLEKADAKPENPDTPDEPENPDTPEKPDKPDNKPNGNQGSGDKGNSNVSQTTNNTSGTKAVKTGDGAQAMLWMIIAVMAVIAGVGAGFRRRKM